MSDDSLIVAIDHVAIVVRDLEAAATFFEDVLGLESCETIERSDLRSRFFDCHGIKIEVIEIHDHDQQVERLGDASARIEHIAFEVTDATSMAGRLAAAEIVTLEPRRSRGRVAFFAHDRAAKTVLYQFVQHLSHLPQTRRL